MGRDAIHGPGFMFGQVKRLRRKASFGFTPYFKVERDTLHNTINSVCFSTRERSPSQTRQHLARPKVPNSRLDRRSLCPNRQVPRCKTGREQQNQRPNLKLTAWPGTNGMVLGTHAFWLMLSGRCQVRNISSTRRSHSLST